MSDLPGVLRRGPGHGRRRRRRRAVVAITVVAGLAAAAGVAVAATGAGGAQRRVAAPGATPSASAPGSSQPGSSRPASSAAGSSSRAGTSRSGTPKQGTSSPPAPKAGTSPSPTSHPSPRPTSPQPTPSHAPGNGHSLAPAWGALFGAWAQPASGSEVTAIRSLESAVGKKFAIVQLYVNWGHAMPLSTASWILHDGSVPMITWSGARTDLIARGVYDSQIRTVARQLRALHGPVLLRWFAEMDLTVSKPDFVSGPDFVRAWRHMHAIFASVGATNVRWVWCPNASAFTAGSAQRYYPGNSYVDWIGADGYNWAPELPHAHWRSFAQIFSTFYRWGRSTGKPLLVGEFGVLEAKPGAKASWFRQAAQQLRSDFPDIHAVVYFNSNHVNFGRHFNWKVTSSSSALAAFRAFAGDPYFSVRPA